MKIELTQITIRDLVADYIDSQEEGVVGYSGKLNIRPAYQREFVYKDKQRDDVIRSVKKDFPLNVMYWVNAGDSFELLDGQQRTISICSYVNNDFSVDGFFMAGLPGDIKKKILDYKLMIYLCEGKNSEVLDWFKIINIAGEVLFPQELRNAVYTGTWLSDAKVFFSKNGCPAHGIAEKYMTAKAIRQEYLEAAIKWHANAASDDDIRRYMGEKQQEQNANELKQYFRQIFNWVEDTFPPVSNYPKEMKGVDWGSLYNAHGKDTINTDQIAKRIKELMMDVDVDNQKGIFAYVLDKRERHLNIRQFSDPMKRKVFEKQGGKCAACGTASMIGGMEGDHIKPWSEGGKTEESNCQMLCKQCNREKSNK